MHEHVCIHALKEIIVNFQPLKIVGKIFNFIIPHTFEKKQEKLFGLNIQNVLWRHNSLNYSYHLSIFIL